MIHNIWVRRAASWLGIVLNIIPVLILFSIMSGEGGSVPLIFFLLTLSLVISIAGIYLNKEKSLINMRVAILGTSITIGITALILFIVSITDVSQIV